MSRRLPEPTRHTFVDRGFGPITLEVLDTGAQTGSGRPPVILCHGFPELAYSWRHQIPAVAAAGFRAVAPDQRGYGGSSAPNAINAYTLDELCGDLVDLCDALSAQRAVFVGHDWGGFIAWAMGVLHPQRCAGIVGVCTPYTAFPTTAYLRAMFGDDDEAMYMLWFQEPGVAEAVLDRDPRLLFEQLMLGGIDPARLAEVGIERRAGRRFNPFLDLGTAAAAVAGAAPRVASDDELAVYAAAFAVTGFAGGINWYRNIDANATAHPEVGTALIDVPSLMLCAEWDPALPPALARGMGTRVPDLETHVIERAGHWVQQERPDEVSRLLVDWLDRRFGDGSHAGRAAG